MTKASVLPDANGHFGPYGGRFVSETLFAALDELSDTYDLLWQNPAFQAEFDLDMAQRAGVRSIAMTYGAHSEKRLAVFDPIVCLDNFRGIKKYLL